MPAGTLGPRSATVKAARRLHRRAFRAKARRFLAEGPQAVGEALTRPEAGRLQVFATAAATDRHAELLDRAAAAGAELHRVTDEALRSLAGTVSPRGLVASCPYLDVDLGAVFAGPPRLVAVLVHVRDPGNAGTILRTADAAGADAVVFTDASVDAYNAKCVRSAAGSLFHLPVVNGSPVADVVPAARAAGLQVLAADAGGTAGVDELASHGVLARPTAWLFGNEAWGLAGAAADLADLAVRVPIHGRAESLNLAVSAALCIYASAEAQRSGSSLVRQDEPGSGAGT